MLVWFVFINGIHFQESAKLEYGRLLWRRPEYRQRLLEHWRDPRHPHADRFSKWETEVQRILYSVPNSDAELDAELRQRGSSLRMVVKEIPSVFGSFFGDTDTRLLNENSKPSLNGSITLNDSCAKKAATT